VTDAPLLVAKGIVAGYGGVPVLAGIDLTVAAGSIVAVLGANGVGKSTLFALLMGQLHADAGSAELPAQWEIANVAQETPALQQSALDFVLDGDHGLRALEAQLALAEQSGDGNAIGHLHGELAHIDGYSAPARAARLLDGLGFAT